MSEICSISEGDMCYGKNKERREIMYAEKMKETIS